MDLNRISSKKLTGFHKTAIFLISMGEDFTAEFFKKIDKKHIKKIGRYMSQISFIPSSILDAVMNEFVHNYENDVNLLVSGKSLLKKVVEKNLDENTAREVYKAIESDAAAEPFSEIANIPAQKLLNILSGEHPQTVALILSHLPDEKAAEILCLFSDDLKADIAYRIVQISEVQDELIRDLDSILKTELSRISTFSRKFDGIEALANILNEVDRSTEESIIRHIENEDKSIAKFIKQKMFAFENLLQVDNKSFREILQNVGNDVMVKAIKTASEDLQDKIFSNLSERASEMMREDLEVLGPVKLREVEEAQQKIIRIAKKLEAEGKIVIARKKKEDIYV